jgi:GNAT superfamily N-acetyltransferase
MELVVRDLESTDREDVLEISKHIWDGHDYIPQALDIWLNDDECHTLVAETDGKVVGIANMRVIDQGKTGWMEGLRVHPDYRGKGIANILTDEIVKRAIKESIIRLRYTTASVNHASIVIAERIAMTRRFEMGVLLKEVPQVKMEQQHSIRLITSTELYPILRHKPNLVPDDILIFDWKAFDSNLTNLKKIEECESLWISLVDSVIESFAIAAVRRVSAGTIWTFTVYPEDSDSLLKQIHFHLSLATKNQCELVFCTYPIQFRPLLDEIGFISHDEGEEDFILYLYEKILDDS